MMSNNWRPNNGTRTNVAFRVRLKTKKGKKWIRNIFYECIRRRLYLFRWIYWWGLKYSISCKRIRPSTLQKWVVLDKTQNWSDGETTVVEICRIWGTPSLLSLPGPLWLGVMPSVSQINPLKISRIWWDQVEKLPLQKQRQKIVNINVQWTRFPKLMT